MQQRPANRSTRHLPDVGEKRAQRFLSHYTLSSPTTTDVASQPILACRFVPAVTTSNHGANQGAIVAAPVTPRVPLVPAFMTRKNPMMHVAGVVAVISITAGNTITSEGTSECE